VDYESGTYAAEQFNNCIYGFGVATPTVPTGTPTITPIAPTPTLDFCGLSDLSLDQWLACYYGYTYLTPTLTPTRTLTQAEICINTFGIPCDLDTEAGVWVLNFMGGIVVAFDDAGNWIGTAFTDADEWLSNSALNDAGEWLKNAANDVANAVGDFFSGLFG